MSKHTVDVVRIKEIKKHPNADSLGIVPVGGFSVCVALKDWKPGDLGAYVAPDSIVPTNNPLFAFLCDGKTDSARIRVKRLRGVYSQGLLVPAPDGYEEGDDVAEVLGVTHYEPPIHYTQKGECEPEPEGLHVPVYDIENFNRFPNIIELGECVVATEKIHGANGRFLFWDGRFRCGSRQLWKRESESDLWWMALRTCPSLMAFLEANPGTVAWGEVYGKVQSLKYGIPNGIALRIFDLYDAKAGTFANADALRGVCGSWGIQTVPFLFDGGFDEVELRGLAEGKSVIPGADNIREGIVIRPTRERWHAAIGRVQLKMISNAYLEKN